MSAAAFVAPLADWLGTFAVHSTCALGAAWGLTALLRDRALAFQERLLRFSLWAALASATLQCFVIGSPLPLLLPEVAVPPAWTVESLLAELGDDAPAAGGAAIAAPATATAPLFTPAALVVLAALLLAGGAGWLLLAYLRLRTVLGGREPVTEPHVLAAAARIAHALGLPQSPRLSRSPALATPIAFGWLQPEICLPPRAAGLGSESLQALLAHEVAHLRRRDPAWMWLAAGLQALFPWQPLFAVVRRRWTRLVELRCDAIAGQHSSPTAVARCLLDVAEWLRPAAPVPLVALGMAARPSALRERIEAALRPGPAGAPRRGWSAAFGGLSLSALSLFGPAVRTADAEGPGAAALAPAGIASLRQAAAMLDAEYAAAQREAQQLRVGLARHPAAQELEPLVATVSQRLLVVERLRTRLRELLDRREAASPSTPTPRSRP